MKVFFTVKGKKLVKMDEVIPKSYRKGVVSQEITSDFVLEIFEKSKKARTKKRKEELQKTAEELSKHIGKFLVEWIIQDQMLAFDNMYDIITYG